MAIIQDKSVILSGGYKSNGDYSAKVYFFNIEANKWESLPKLNKNRSSHASLAVGQKVYVACGNDGSTLLNSVEFMDFSESPGFFSSRSWKIIFLQQIKPRSSILFS